MIFLSSQNLTVKEDLHAHFKRARLTKSDLPLRIHVLAYTDQNSNLMQAILSALGDTKISPTDKLNELFYYSQGFVKTYHHSSYFSLTVWSKKVKNFNFGLDNMYHQPLEIPSGGKLTELEILVGNQNLSHQEINKLFRQQILYCSRVFNNFAEIYTTFQPDSHNRERYLVKTIKEASVDKLELVVDLIIQLENSFHLLYEPKPAVQALIKQLTAIENRGSQALKEINEKLTVATPNKLKKWLEEITKDYSQLAEINDKLSSKLNDALSLKNTLQEIFLELQESPVLELTEISKPITTLTIKKTAEYARVLSRVQAARNRRLDVIKILRTRLDILEREQAFALQCSMHETTNAQMAMQKSIEGLYVFIVAFYLTELARIIFEALHIKHLIAINPTLLAAAFIPIALLAGLILAGKIKLNRFK